MSLKLRDSTFVIVREDLAEDAKTLVTEGLRLGRSPECDVVLNHPTVSRLHAGINEVGGRFYIVNLSGSNATTINGRVVPFDEADALAKGDTLQIGPFFLYVEQAAERSLKIRAALQVALNVGDMKAREAAEAGGAGKQPQQSATSPDAVASSEIAGALKVFWDKRTREKAERQSPLHPHNPPRLGKARFNWTPTRDLVRPWPLSVFIWGVVVVGALTAFAAFRYKDAFAPEVVSSAHARESFLLNPPVALEPNANSCTTCHALGVKLENRALMEQNCATCHQTEAFVATTTKAHRDAGITCIVCHTEHRGAGFEPMGAALDACARCHSDSNKKLYNGKPVHTPHGGNIGYPVAGGEWVWKGLDEEELALKPQIAKLRKPQDTEQEWRNKQFHALHIYRVRAVASIEGIKDEDAGDGSRVISCSSCHTSFAPVDRETPRSTCVRCHNGLVFRENPRSARSGSTLSCTSCHIQHTRDDHWRPAIFAEMPLPKDWNERVMGK